MLKEVDGKTVRSALEYVKLIIGNTYAIDNMICSLVIDQIFVTLEEYGVADKPLLAEEEERK